MQNQAYFNKKPGADFIQQTFVAAINGGKGCPSHLNQYLLLMLVRSDQLLPLA